MNTQKGNLLLDQGSYDEAKAEFERAIKINPNDAEAHNGLGRVALVQQRFEDAERAFRKASELIPQEPAFHCNLGLALQNLNKYPEAIERYQKAIDVDPKHIDAYNNWGDALANQKKYAEAIEKYEKTVEIDPKYADAYYNWGNVLLDQKRYDEAVEKYDKAVKVNNSYAYAYHNKAYILERQGNYKAAKETWLEARNAYEKAKKERSLFSRDDDFQYLGGMLHSVFHDLNKAEKIYKEGLSLNPNHVGILSGLVDLYLDRKDDEDGEGRTTAYWNARQAYIKAESLLEDQIKQAEDASSLLQLGQLKLAMEEYSEAEEWLLKSVDKEKELAAAYTSLGVVLTRRQRFKKAIQYYEDSLRRDPDNLTVRSNLAEACLKSKMVDRAESEYKKILEITSDHVESLIGLGEVYTAMAEDGDGDMYEQAIEYFTRGKKKAESGEGSKNLKKKDLAALLYSRGYASVKLYEAPKTRRDEKQLREAERDFKECVQNDPEHHKAKRALEKIQKRLERFSTQSLTERIGPWVVAILALYIFGATQIGFFYGHTRSAEPPSINEAVSKAASVEVAPVKDDVAKGKEATRAPDAVHSAAKKGASKSAEVPVKTEGGDTSKDKEVKSTSKPEAAAPGPMGAGYYALLSFGSLIFMIAGLYLPQILKLKVAGIELEKSSVDQITTTGSLGIRK